MGKRPKLSFVIDRKPQTRRPSIARKIGIALSLCESKDYHVKYQGGIA